MRKEWTEKDYYAALGVAKDASEKDIKKAFRKLARRYHPDNNPDDAAAEARFKEINEAYEVLSDPEDRKEYDHVRDMGYFVGGPGGDQQYVRVEDLFGGRAEGSQFDLFGGLGDLFGRSGGRRAQPQPAAGNDLEGDLSLSFHDALRGATREMVVNGTTIKVKVPQGVADGAKIRLTGKGGPGRNGGPPGNLYVRVHVADHPVFGRAGKRNLTIDVPVTFAEATLGAAINVPTLDGKTRIRVPAGTAHGTTFSVKGKGIETPQGTGDLLVTVQVEVPTDLSAEQRALLERFQAERAAPNPRSHLGV